MWPKYSEERRKDRLATEAVLSQKPQIAHDEMPSCFPACSQHQWQIAAHAMQDAS